MNNRTDDLPPILNALRTLVQALQAGSRDSEKRVGLTGAQLFVLEKLRDSSGGKREGMSVNALAEATHTHQSTVSVVVSKLVKKGLVSRVRSESDARVQMLSITRQGAQKLAAAPETVQDRLVRTLRSMPKADRARLAKNLDMLIAQSGLSSVNPELFLESKTNGQRRIR